MGSNPLSSGEFHSHLVNFLRKAVTIYDDKRRSQKSKNLHNVNPGRKKDLHLQKFQLTLRLIEEFEKETIRNETGFLVVNLPTKRQRILSEYSEIEKIPWYVPQCDRLLNRLDREGVEIWDLVPVFSKLPESTYYFKNDGHMTKYGHQVVASNIHEFILPHVLSQIAHPWNVENLATARKK
jgi:hypothetical protein